MKKILERSVSIRTRHLSWFGSSNSAKKSGLFGNQLNKPSDFDRETKEAIADIQTCVSNVVNTDIENVVEAVDSLSNRICLTADMSDCIRSIHPDDNIAEAAD